MRPHQYWWRRTHDLNELFLEELMVAAKGKGAAGCASVRHCVVVNPSDRLVDVRSVSDVRFISVSTNALEIPMNLFGLIPFHGNSSINTMLYFM